MRFLQVLAIAIAFCAAAGSAFPASADDDGPTDGAPHRFETWFPKVKPEAVESEPAGPDEEGDLDLDPLPIDTSFQVRPGDTFKKVLGRAGVAPRESDRAMRALIKVFDPRRLKPGIEIFLQIQPPASEDGAPSLLSIDFTPNGETEISVLREGDGSYSAENFERALFPTLAYGRGTVRSSLYVAGKKADIPRGILTDLVTLYSFDVDFQREVQPGDAFEILYQQLRDETGEPIREGDIVMASMTVAGATTTLYRFKTKSGFADYFDKTGQSAQKSLLRTPTDAARMTSGFGRRRHPILGYTRMHRGIDFAGPPGAPVYAAGDGLIEKAGWAGSFGKYIRIRHPGSYKTAYAHLRGFAAGIRAGKRVKQRQIIGYIGSTGRATGAHLHYEVIYKGRQINPLKLKLAAGYSLKGKELRRFKAAAADSRKRLAEFRAERGKQARGGNGAE